MARKPARPIGNTDRKKPIPNNNTSATRAIVLPNLRVRLVLAGAAFPATGWLTACCVCSCASLLIISPRTLVFLLAMTYASLCTTGFYQVVYARVVLKGMGQMTHSCCKQYSNNSGL